MSKKKPTPEQRDQWDATYREKDPERFRRMAAERAQRWRDRHPGAGAEATKRTRDPVKHAAQERVRHAVKTGRLMRLPCEVCGTTAHAHHDDYTRPLDVRWLCGVHHRARHRELARLLCPECGSRDVVAVTADTEGTPCARLCNDCGMYSGYEDGT